ncbi:MAG: hypothetical protein ACXWZT_05885, partial [Gaiellaceae bacterium]
MRGVGPEQVEYAGSAERLRDVWIAVRANLRARANRVKWEPESVPYNRSGEPFHPQRRRPELRDFP